MKKRIRVGHLLCAALLVAGVAIGTTAIAETAATELTVSELSLASSLADGVPETTATSFERAPQWIYCFMRLDNPTREETSVRVTFEPAEGEVARAGGGTRLSVPARAHHRTVARTSANRPAGSYRCVVRDDGGNALRHADFRITE